MKRQASIFLLLPLLALPSGNIWALPAPVSVSTPLGGDPFMVEALRGEEAISGLYAFTVNLAAARDRAVPFDALLGQEATITVALSGTPTRYFNGIVSRVSAGDVDTRAHFGI